MIRKLLIVAASGFVLAILSFSAAWVIGGREALTRFERDGRIAILVDDESDGGPLVTRTLSFDPDSVLNVKAVADIRFVRGDKPEMTVKGPEHLMKALQWDRNVLSLSKYSGPFQGGLEVRIVAPRIAGLTVSAPADIELRDLDQERLKIVIDGAGNLDATGQVATLDVESNGASDLDLSRLVAKDARIAINGAGNADINASGTVDAAIAGAGSISLRQKPKSLTSRINGIGSIEEDY